MSEKIEDPKEPIEQEKEQPQSLSKIETAEVTKFQALIDKLDPKHVNYAQQKAHYELLTRQAVIHP